MKKSIPIHPIALAFPALSEKEMAELVESISTFGLLHSIVLFEGKILDGRHRYEACRLAGVDPEFEQYRGDDPYAFVIAANLARRHLTTSQRANLGAELAASMEEDAIARREKNLKKGDKPPEGVNLPFPLGASAARAGEMLGVSEKSVKTAKSVMEKSPELHAKIKAGEMTVNQAANQLKKEQNKDSVIEDATGYPVPKELWPVWERRLEPFNMRKTIAEMQNKLDAALKEKDPVFRCRELQDIIISLGNVHSKMMALQLHAVCPYCQGRSITKCTNCCGRGIVSKFFWDTAVPQEVKRIRKEAK